MPIHFSNSIIFWNIFFIGKSLNHHFHSYVSHYQGRILPPQAQETWFLPDCAAT
jgi:hypothetical protein